MQKEEGSFTSMIYLICALMCWCGIIPITMVLYLFYCCLFNDFGDCREIRYRSIVFEYALKSWFLPTVA